MLRRKHGLAGKPIQPHGFTAIEILGAVTLLLILGALSIKPLSGYIQFLRAKSAADGLKHYLILVRSQAIANPSRHCGVAFRLHGKNSPLDDSVIAFFDVPADMAYDPKKDPPYSKPYVLSRRDKVYAEIPNPFPSVLVFRGDGSAQASLKLNLYLKQFESTLDVLASTGRVKVVVK